MKKLYIIFISVLSIANVSLCQTLVTPAAAQAQPILLEGATIHPGNGDIIENGKIAFNNGKITMIGLVNEAFESSEYQVINIAGKHVYPGFILPATNLGLREVSSFRATIDEEEQGLINPNVRSLIAYNTDSELIPTMRFNGILIAQVRPFGGLVSGTSSIVQLDAWNWEDAVVVADDGLFMSWPNRNRREFNYSNYQFESVPNKNYPQQVQDLTSLFQSALSYIDKNNAVPLNLKLEAMTGLFDNSKTLYIEANEAKNIIESIKFAKSMEVKKIVLVGGEESYLVLDFLKDENIPVILNDVHRLPSQPDQDYDMPYKLPFLLSEEGILVGLTYDETQSARNLAFFAGTAAAYGMEKEEALKLITANTAKILGVFDEVGSLEPGKNATLFVAEGDALDMRTNRIYKAYIDGREIQLDATQQVLFEKFKKKYEQE